MTQQDSARYVYGGRETQMFQRLPGFKNLIVWQQASDLSTLIDELAPGFGAGWWKLAEQLRAAAWSVCGNLAEGYGRGAVGDYLRFCEIARGSLFEVGAYLQQCERAGLAGGDRLSILIARYSQTTLLLDRLIQGIQKRKAQGTWNRSLPLREPTEAYRADTDMVHAAQELSPEPIVADWTVWGTLSGPSDFLSEDV